MIDPIRALIAATSETANRREARAAWAREAVAAWREAQREMDARLDAAVARLSEEDFERLCDEEGARVEALRAPLMAVKERDVWPRELYWSGL
jgi:hypothetical protein